MELQEFLDYMNSGKTAKGMSEELAYSGYLTQEALKITAKINMGYRMSMKWAKSVQTAGSEQPGDFASMFARLNDNILFGEVWNEGILPVKTIGGNTSEAAHRASDFAAMGVQEVYEGKEPT